MKNTKETARQRWDEILSKPFEREAELARLRFGLGGKRPMAIDKIARTLRLSRERVRQIEAEARNKLEKILPQSIP